MKRVAYEEMVAQFTRVLGKHGFTPSDAKDAAVIFAQNSLSGVYSHGLNRFPRVVSYLERARSTHLPAPSASPAWQYGALGRPPRLRPAERTARNGACLRPRQRERRRHRGIGQQQPLDARRHLRLAGRRKSCIGICWSNTAPNMPAWGAKDCRIGNNPLILAVPRSDGQHVMVDCALSQFSYGKLESTRLAGRQLPVPGGCDEDGQPTTDPAAIEKSGRALPIGYWKGSGLSILLDLIATLLSGGNAVHTIGTFGDEIGLTQIMIAIDPTKFGTVEENDAVIDAILADIKASTPARPDGEVRWPGEGMLRTIKENRELGVPVVEEIWESVLKM